MTEEIQEASKTTKFLSILRNETKKKIIIWIGGILWSIACYFSGMIITKWYDRYEDLDYLRNEIEFNITEMTQTIEILDQFNKFFESEFRIEEKTFYDYFPPRPILSSIWFYLDSSNKDNPIWNLSRSKAQARNYVIKEFSKNGKIYAIKNNDDIKFLERLDSEIFEINNSLAGVYISFDELAKRSKRVGRKQDLDDLRKSVDDNKKGTLERIKKIKSVTERVIQRLTSIRKSI